MRRVVVAVVVAGIVAGGALVVAGYYTGGPLAELLGVEVTTHEPVAASTLGQGGDPLVINIGVSWPHEGYCSGQFTVSAVESDTEVRVDEVVSRVPRAGGSCAGLGTADGIAWTPLELAAPLGDRHLVRSSDGSVIPLERR